MNFETVERCGRVYVVKKGVESAGFAQRGPHGWVTMRIPRVQYVAYNRTDALNLIARDMDTWHTVGEAADRLVELGVFNTPPSTQTMSKWARKGLFPGVVMVPTQGRGGSRRWPEAALVAFAKRRMEK